MELFSLIILTLLVIYATVAAFAVVQDTTTTEDEEDMKSALAFSKTHFWRHMLPGWSCESNQLKKAKEIRFKETVENKLVDFCRQWKLMAFAASVYVTSWEYKENNKELKTAKEIVRSSSCFPNIKDEKEIFLRLSMVPKFQVTDGELQLSSAMKVIASVYRDLFKWGKGKNLEFKMEFENKNDWFKELDNEDPAEEINMNLAGLHPEENKKFNRIYEKLTKLLDQIHRVCRLKEELQKQKFWEMWKLVVEIGLDMEVICKDGKEDSNLEQTKVEFSCPYLEIRLRKLLTKYKSEMKLKSDPCEDAKLRLKKKQIPKFNGIQYKV